MTRKELTIRVLLVEDNPSDARLVEMMLTEKPDSAFLVDRVARLSDAVRLIGEKSFDVVLLDLGLPDSSGLETASAMVEAAPSLPIVVLTGLDDEEIGMEAVRRGVQDYLVKDHIDSSLVRRAARYAIDRHAAFQVLRHQLAFQQQMIDALPLPVFYTDATLAVLGCNRVFEELTGLERFDLLGGHVHEVLPEGLAAALSEEDLGEVGVSRIHRVSFPDAKGTLCQGTLTATPFDDPLGKLAGLVLSIETEPGDTAA
ncbi:MAG: response regulator [Magnetospirillum sp. WYHS-4]